MWFLFLLSLPLYPAQLRTLSDTPHVLGSKSPCQSSITMLSSSPTVSSQKNTYEQTHTLIKNELQLEVNHIQIAVSEIRGKNEITYAKTQTVHNLRCHMRKHYFQMAQSRLHLKKIYSWLVFNKEQAIPSHLLFSSTSKGTHKTYC